MLLVIDTHPIQYHAPVFRAVEQDYGIPVLAVYQSDRSLTGYHDAEFATQVAWDTDLLSGYSSVFLTTTDGPRSGFSAALKRLLDQQRATAVLLNGYAHPFYRAAIRLLWRRHTPILLRGDTTDAAWKRSWLKHRLRDFVLRRFYSRCDKLLYLGSNSREHFLRLGVDEQKLVFSPHCVDDSAFRLGADDRRRARAETRSRLNIAPEQWVVAFSGKLSHRKGPDLLVKAAARLRTPPVLLFIGAGQMRSDLEQLAASHGVNAIFVGFKNQTELSDMYHAADALALPSRDTETWGLVVNEALLHGLPVVASDAVGSARDLVVSGVTGDIFQACSVDDLARSLTVISSMVGRPAVTRSCTERVRPYSVAEAARGIAEVYRLLADRRAS